MGDERAWAAGLFDGEGSVGCYGRPDGRKRRGSYWHIRLSVAQHHDREVLDRFVAAVGVGKVYGPYQGRKYSVQVVGENAERVIEQIWPWLSGPKRRQIEAARAKFLSRDAGTTGGRICPSDCQCGRHKWKTEDMAPETRLKRERAREYQRRSRAKRRCTCPPRETPLGPHGEWKDPWLMGPSHEADCPLFSADQQVSYS